MTDDAKVSLTCTSCNKTRAYTPSSLTCFDCAVRDIVVKSGFDSKKAKLRDIREFAYLTILSFVPIIAVDHYCGRTAEIIAIVFFGFGQIVGPLVRWLARKF